MSSGSLFISTTLAVSIATSVPAPIAMPMSACASAGASLTPSPTIATSLPSACSCLTWPALSAGSTSAKTRVDPQLARDRLGGARVVAGDHHRLDAQLLELGDRLARGRLDRVGHGDQPGRAGRRPPRDIGVLPCCGQLRGLPPSSAGDVDALRRAAACGCRPAPRRPSTVAANAVPGDRLERRSRRPSVEPALARARRRSPRPAGAPSRARRAPTRRSSSSSSSPSVATTSVSARLALGQRAGLVEDDRLDAGDALRATRRP